ncbi:MAG: HIT family protein [Candidatus Altiarchaeota archaeon]|nr:HIT family protein [Candidatus Altiarchaeota archaeon]
MTQKESCIFCEIIAGKEKAWKLFEDDKCIVILDAFPINEGHVIIMPKQHVKDIFEIDEPTFLHICKIARWIASETKTVLKAEYVNMVTASSIIPHAFMHIIPRYDYDLMGLLPDMENKRKMSNEEMETTYKKIRGALDGFRKKNKRKTS